MARSAKNSRKKERMQSNPVKSGTNPYSPGTSAHVPRTKPKRASKGQKGRRSLNG